MLHKSHISNIEIYTEEWDIIRRGRLTSSKAISIAAEKWPSAGAMTYIYQKAGEVVTGQTLADENDIIIEDENTAWGLEHEYRALNQFGVAMKIKFLVTQKIIFDPKGNESSTPDALWIIDSSVIKEDCYNVATVEVKCPRKYARFFPLYECDTPEKLKRHEKKYYYQVLDQMLVCGASVGYFVCYHPLFPPGKNMRIIKFSKIELWEDFKFLEQRKKLAVEKLKEIIQEFSVKK